MELPAMPLIQRNNSLALAAARIAAGIDVETKMLQPITGTPTT